MRRTVRFCFLCLVVTLATLPVLGRGGPYIRGFTWHFAGSILETSFSVGDAMDRADMKEAILSTRPVTITFTAQVLKHRLFWKDKVLASKVVKHTVQYDTLTHQFSVQTLVGDELRDHRILATWKDMAGYMRSVSNVAVVSVADMEPSNGAYFLAVRVHLLSHFVFWIIPWDIQTPWVSKKLATP